MSETTGILKVPGLSLLYSQDTWALSKIWPGRTDELTDAPRQQAMSITTGLDIGRLLTGATPSHWRLEELSSRLQEAITSLRSAIADLHVDDEQARPSDGTVGKAQHLLWLLPNNVPLPAISVEPDGAIAFDWIFLRDRMFSITVSDADKLAYAWLNGNDRGHGVASLRGKVLPEPIPTLLATLTRDEHASIGAA